MTTSQGEKQGKIAPALTFPLPWALLGVFPIDQTHLEARRQNPSSSMQVIRPTQSWNLGQSIIIHGGFDLITRPRNVYLQINV